MKLLLVQLFQFSLCLAAACPPKYSKIQHPPTVCTYFEPFNHSSPVGTNDYINIAKIWKESWSRHGWRTLILSRKDAENHPRFEEAIDYLQNLPTVNDRTYELSCYLRWFSAVQAGCGWMSDIDMINYGFPPQLPWNGPVLYSFNGFVPSLVTGSKEAFEAVIDAFITLARNTTFALSTDINPFFSFPDGRVFTSDMLILRSRPELYLDLKFPTSIAGADVNRSLLLHFDKAEVRRWGLKYGLPALKCEAVRMIRNV